MIKIGNKNFKTKKEAEDFIREILYRYPLNEKLKGDDLIFVLNLLENHPEKDAKIGPGVKSIIIEEEERFSKTRHFSVVRTDNTIEDFSFKKCLSSNLNEPIKLFRSSARQAIADQIISFKEEYFKENQDSNGNVICKITGVTVDRNNSHIDHTSPLTFDKIVLDFIKKNNIVVDSIKFVKASDGIGRNFADSSLINSFSDYHKKIARLRVVSQTANLKQKKK